MPSRASPSSSPGLWPTIRRGDCEWLPAATSSPPWQPEPSAWRAGSGRRVLRVQQPGLRVAFGRLPATRCWGRWHLLRPTVGHMASNAGDNLGAVAGPLLAAGLVGLIGIRHTIYLSVIPGLFAAVAITIAAREARKRPIQAIRRRARLELGKLREPGLIRPLLPIAAFELGNVATTLLILRATTLLHHGGRSATTATSLAVLIYAGHNLFGSGSQPPEAIGSTEPGRASSSRPALRSTSWPTRSSPCCSTVGPSWSVPSSSPGAGSVWPKPPSQLSWRACSPINSAVAASDSSAACSPSGTSHPPPRSACCGRWSPLRSGSSTRRVGWPCRRSHRSALSTRRRRGTTSDNLPSHRRRIG